MAFPFPALEGPSVDGRRGTAATTDGVFSGVFEVQREKETSRKNGGIKGENGGAEGERG